ncbi:aminoglycoside/choline kinase family phosphotransferase [Parabacteroides sp. PF5-5]|uniref:RapZ C-terminal domain-containing protein n=1 Tax=unclassified Parabacteroides TaxID=2649774 RepID=UPI00247691DD|nr:MULTISPECIES: RNase adapter RapZ [unclassified Parabacteroides]MDH6305360.1 aminoglycoside/choline kinase family phosphotransferase [Parabacteroides sp. PH5-39]MDH6316713.1 aminoglycoside/choline kinase family phosphotransferase [Parabacteroides sp. PF5-13]MDH6320107.1 aminoglycoside/choline kinase family phosphotransferase [Parabacteroides sp. PH5-13]MDH6323950.1 aminoglycoside/choline kinase family phosphotransferase [Parabacteroides sp. PH5-8]MDH6327784.1 aminoglycoside/choline kinase fa
MIIDELKKLYFSNTGSQPQEVTELPSSGSNRRYFRLAGDKTLIGVSGTSKEENEAFVYMANHFRQKGLNVPEVYSFSDDKLYYLQEDLGDTLLFNAIEKGRKSCVFDDKERQLLHQTITRLPAMQINGAEGFDFSKCYPQPAFNERSILWDLNYFKYCFLKATGMEFQEDKLEDDFQKMSDVLLRDSSNTFLYRDFQSRNVMIKDDKPWFIDFQGGRKGPVYYDVASFLWQAKAQFPEELRNELLDAYIEALSQYKPVDKIYFIEQLRHFVLFRTLQVLGAYGFRGYFEKKPHFIQSVPFAIANLRQLLREDYPEYPYLCTVLRELTNLKQFSDDIRKRMLEVKIVSFAYKKGIPNDPTGNGGGFVFDCRAINNPGKYERYNHFTGLDEPVINFLENDGEITQYLEHVYTIVDASVKRYLDRGFTNLMVCFGCTGGQHRSVYSAQHLAEHLHNKFKVKIHLTHREQNIEQIYDAVL